MLQEPYVRKIAALVGVAAIVALSAYTYSVLKEAKYMFSEPTTISVSGTGEVFATPDIATFNFTVEGKGDDAVSAQNEVAETMDEINSYLLDVGVEEKDVKTNYYNLTPRYEYPDSDCDGWGYCPPSRKEPTLIGYEVNQSISVKVRDTEKAGEIISTVGQMGAMNVSGLSFTIDDEDVLYAEAREKAIDDAREKAEVLAENLDAHIVRMNGYWEEDGGYAMEYGRGANTKIMFDTAESAILQAATLPLGEDTVTVQVNISYEIR